MYSLSNYIMDGLTQLKIMVYYVRVFFFLILAAPARQYYRYRTKHTASEKGNSPNNIINCSFKFLAIPVSTKSFADPE